MFHLEEIGSMRYSVNCCKIGLMRDDEWICFCGEAWKKTGSTTMTKVLGWIQLICYDKKPGSSTLNCHGNYQVLTSKDRNQHWKFFWQVFFCVYIPFEMIIWNFLLYQRKYKIASFHFQKILHDCPLLSPPRLCALCRPPSAPEVRPICFILQNTVLLPILEIQRFFQTSK